MSAFIQKVLFNMLAVQCTLCNTRTLHPESAGRIQICETCAKVHLGDSEEE